MTNTTMEKFGYPDRLIGELTSWAVLLRPMQATLGSLVLICREEATSLGELSEQASREFGIACSRLEALLSAAFSPDKFNYLALMMIDPHVHFHVLPRYETERTFQDRTFIDANWPKPPDLFEPIQFSEEQMADLLTTLRKHW